MNTSNTGDYNTGDCNTGRYNTGNHNTGNRNTGYYNTGRYNTGDYNTGERNTGRYNTGDRNTGYCNTNTPTVRLFNKDSGWSFYGVEHIRFRSVMQEYQKPLCEWVSESYMSEEEKKENPTYVTTGGYLKVNEDTFNGKDVTPEHVEYFKSLPNFDADILLECTGIDITNQKKKIIVDGKEILISKESFDDIRRQFMGEK